MAILVIGGSGFLGSSLITRLVRQGETVVSTSRRSVAVWDGSLSVKCRQLDLRTFDCWDQLLDGISTVYHLAWSTVPATAAAAPVSDVEDNVIGSLRLLEALKAYPAIRLVFASSGGTVYGALARVPAHEEDPTIPVSAHGTAKLAVERYIEQFGQLYGVDSVILRIGNTYGPGQGFSRIFGSVAAFCRHAAANEPIPIFGDGSIIRDYVFIDDVVEAMLLAGSAVVRHRTFNIGSGRGTSLSELVELIGFILHRSSVVQYMPSRSYDIPISVLDIKRARTELGWRPQIAIENGIAHVLRWHSGGGELP